MTNPILVSTDPAKAFSEVWRRLQRLEQGVGSPGFTSTGNTFEDILLGPTGSQVTLDTIPPGTPTGVTATPGAFGERSFVDVQWTATAQATSYQIELAENNAGVRSIVEMVVGIATYYRFDNLKHNQNFSVRVAAVNRMGVVGSFSAWLDFTPITDSTVPGALTGLTVFRGAASVIASWDASTADDVKNGRGLYAVELSNNNFTSVLASARTGAQVHVFEGQSAEATYSVRVAAIDSSGNQGPWSSVVSATAGGIINSMIVAGTIVGDRIAAGVITTGHMTAGTINGDRITSNTIDVAKLLADSILAKNINIGAGGQFKVGSNPGAGTSGQGAIFNSQGLSFYNSSGVRTIYFSALDGSGTFTGTVSGSNITGSTINGSTITGGTFRTATTGTRIEIDAAPLFSGETAAAFISLFTNKTGGDYRQAEMYAANVDAASFGRRNQLTIQCGLPTSTTKAPVLHMMSETYGGTFHYSDTFLESHFITLSNIGGSSTTFIVKGRQELFSGWADLPVLHVKRNFEQKEGAVIRAENGHVHCTNYSEGAWNTQPFIAHTPVGIRTGYAFWVDDYASATILAWDAPNGEFKCSNADHTAFLAIKASEFRIGSSKRIKRAIEPSTTDLEQFKKLRPVKFQLREDQANKCLKCQGNDPTCAACAMPRSPKNEHPRIGFLAEDVQNVYPGLVTLDVDSIPASIDIGQLTNLAVHVCLAQQAIIDDLSARTAALEVLTKTSK